VQYVIVLHALITTTWAN